MKELIGVVAGAWGLAATLVLACRGLPAEWHEAAEQASAMTASGADDRSVVLITIDGVRWQEVFRGVDPGLARLSGLPEGAVEDARELLPGIHRLFFEEGTALGDPRRRGGISASGSPYISMPGYLELLTGATSDCRRNDCTPSLTRTLA
ncbi:MAG TPA: hypothetical protein VLS89_07895, partial [Candidatus Nanopelagicales bacterium]|nr:hypothetical protein [Candidatus Nanopelagicales bacterium]